MSNQIKRSLTLIELVLILLNFSVCIIYAGMDHGNSLDHPFVDAFWTACRMMGYAYIGRFIGNFIPLIGDICVIGSLSSIIYKMIFMWNIIF